MQQQTAPSNETNRALGELPEWRLADLYSTPSSKEFSADFARAEADARSFKANYQNRLTEMLSDADAPSAICRAVGDFENLEDLLGRIASYAGLLYASNMADQNIAKFYADTDERLTRITSDLLFFTLELNQLDEDLLEEALGKAPLTQYAPWIRDVRLDQPYQLEQSLEELLHEKSVSSRSSWIRLFDETMSAMRFPIDGEDVTSEEALHQLSSSDGAKRKAAAMSLAGVFKENVRTFALITNVLAKDKEIEDRWRGFPDPASARHLSNRVEDEVVEALVEAVRASYPRLSHRYYKLKAKWFGADKLDFWDRNAPLPNMAEPLVSWPEARSAVLSAYDAFSPRMSAIAQRFFDERWIDAPVRPGKSPGAFSHPTTPSAHPYVLLNYQGGTRDVMTLAHELGHGVHQVLAAPQGALLAQTPLTLAETASVFGEMLTFRSMLANSTDPDRRRALLASKVEDMLNTVVRQIAFYSFEREVHMKRRDGELTTNQLAEIWLTVQRESLGPSIRLNDGYETFWCYIPHFVRSPFYVYAYAFGDCLVNSLYAAYEAQPDGFQERYFEILKAGGSKHHGELLEPFGLDARDPEFWTGGLSMIAGFIDDLEGLDQ